MGDVYYAALTALFGLVFGSFLNCTAMRLVRREDFIHGRSHCMTCGHELGARDLVPVLSWVASGGKCRYCGERVSARYPLTEVLFALLCEGVYWRYGLSVRTLGCLVMVGCLFTLSIVDLESYEIPDGILLIGLLAWVATVAFVPRQGGLFAYIAHHIAAGFLCGAIMLALSLVLDRILGKESLGGGDIKLFALLGLYLGYLGAYFLVLLSSVIGLLCAALMRSRRIPFAPSIAVAGYILLLWGEAITEWYLSLIF